MSTIQVTCTMNLTVVQEFTAAEMPSGGDRSLTHNQFNNTRTLNVSSTPPATEVYAKLLTGSQALDFTALVPDVGATIDATGLKLQCLTINNLSTANTVDWADGGANPYSINNTNPIRIEPGASHEMYYNDKLADVAAGVKAVAITATAGQTYELILVFG